MATVALLGMSAVSCDKENEEEPAAPVVAETPADAVKGSYNGYIYMSVAGSTEDPVGGTIVVAKESGNSVKVSVPSVGEGMMALSAFEIEGVGVSQSGDVYTLTKEEFAVSVPRASGEGTIEYTGSLSGTVAGGKLTLEYSVTPGAMPMAITFTFTEEEPGAAASVAGDYEGNMVMSVAGTGYDPVSATVTLVRESAGSVAVTLPAVGEGRMAINGFSIEGVSVVEDGTVYRLVKEEYTASVARASGEGSIEYTGSLSGTVVDGKLTLEYSVTPGAMPMSINFSFSQE